MERSLASDAPSAQTKGVGANGRDARRDMKVGLFGGPSQRHRLMAAASSAGSSRRDLVPGRLPDFVQWITALEVSADFCFQPAGVCWPGDERRARGAGSGAVSTRWECVYGRDTASAVTLLV